MLGLSVSWVVPRAIEGEKTTQGKEPEVPDEPDERQTPEMEQLSFGMVEPPIKVMPGPGKSKSPRKTREPGITKPPSPKEKRIKDVEAALITGAVTTKKEPNVSRAGRTKSSMSTAAGKKTTSLKVAQVPVSDKNGTDHRDTGKKSWETEIYQGNSNGKPEKYK